MRSGTTDGALATFRTSGRRKPPKFSATVTPHRDRSAPFAFTVTGRLTLPAGLSRATGCRGAVQVTASAHGGRIANARATIGHRCGYRVKVRLSGRRVGVSGRPRLTVRFGGTSSLAPTTAAPLVVSYG